MDARRPDTRRLKANAGGRPWLDTRKGVYYAKWYEAPALGSGAKGQTRAVSLHTNDPSEAAAKFAAFLGQGAAIYAENVATDGRTVSKALDDYEREHVEPHV